MPPHMICVIPHLTTACQIRRLRISLPLIEGLIDNAKYFMPKALPAPAGEELRPIARPRIDAPVKPAPREGPKRTRTPWWQMGSRKPDDPLSDHLARRRISQPQYLAGREYQKHAAAKDGAPAAGKWLAKCHAELGQDGSAIARAMLIEGQTAKQIAAARGQTGADWQQYYARRFFLCLATLAEVFGFSSLGAAEPKPSSRPLPSSLGGP
jgi:hypothetical protein